MTRELLLAFAFCFAIGPLLFRMLIAAEGSPARILLLAAAVVVSTVSALWLQVQGLDLASLLLLWLGWVIALTIVALALFRRLPAPRIRRWVTVAGLLATTIPWFGLATARMMIS